MYITTEFTETDTNRIISLANEYAFATLVTVKDGVPFSTHLPLMIEKNETFIIIGHMAKSNKQWKHFKNGSDVLVMYQGPHAYISPSNYEGPGVPTWNYSSIHMYGKATLMTEELEVRNVIETLADKYEKYQSEPWIPKYPERILDAIVGFRIDVNRVEAKSKLSQNRSENDRLNIITNLRSTGSEGAMGVAKLMEENELKKK